MPSHNRQNINYLTKTKKLQTTQKELKFSFWDFLFAIVLHGFLFQVI